MVGWSVENKVSEGLDKCVMIAAPHTSNADLLYTLAAFAELEIPVRFTIKNDWTRMPVIGVFIRALGGVGIDRKPKEESGRKISFVEAMARLFDKHDRLVVLVTPEGTRSKSENWKSGFYHVAKQANVPVAFGFLDYKRKVAGIGGLIYPTQDQEADMRKIMAFYAPIHAKYPEHFAVDSRYRPDENE